MRARSMAFAMLLAASPAAAHDFWLQPDDYRPTPRAETAMTLQVGHGEFRQRSPIAASRIVRFEAIASDGATTDLRGALHLGQADDATLRFEQAGTYVLALETDARAQSHLPAVRFNDYLVAEGLTPAIEARTRSQRTSADGSENYRRVAKSLMQVGPIDAAASTRVTQPIGLPLEIVPERNPYADPEAQTLPVRVFFEQRPLAGALVKLTRLENDAAPLEMQRTDRDGRASFTIPREGSWLLNVIWTRPLPRSSETDFETTFSSFNFGFAR